MISYQIYLGGESKKLVWLTDLHLDAADKESLKAFLLSLVAYNPDMILLGGDICNGAKSLSYIRHLAEKLQKPICFVMGNHDFYHGSIEVNRQLALNLSKNNPLLSYLTAQQIVELDSQTVLIGHDGWSDGRAGDFLHSEILLHDYFLIKELKNLKASERLKKLNSLGKEAANSLKQTLKKVLKKYLQVIILTHTPPFEETCLYEGKQCDLQWAPHFVCVAMGEVLKEIAMQFSKAQILVLCGHSHSPADVQILPNLRVIAAESILGTPHISGVLHI